MNLKISYCGKEGSRPGAADMAEIRKGKRRESLPESQKKAVRVNGKPLE
jgi:hypothetical protein